MTGKNKVLIVEPSVIIAEGLMKILRESMHFEMLSPLYDIEALNGRLAAGKPDILILNPTLLSGSKCSTINSITQDNQQIVVIALVYQYIESAILRSYHGVIDIREERERISEILLECRSSLSTDDLSDDNNYELTKRETDVLILIAKGLMNKEIADRLNISIHTVISHRKNITRKTNIKSVAGLAMFALMNNLVEDNSAI